MINIRLMRWAGNAEHMETPELCPVIQYDSPKNTAIMDNLTASGNIISNQSLWVWTGINWIWLRNAGGP